MNSDEFSLRRRLLVWLRARLLGALAAAANFQYTTDPLV